MGDSPPFPRARYAIRWECGGRPIVCTLFIVGALEQRSLSSSIVYTMLRAGPHCWEAADYETLLCSSNQTIPPIRHHYHRKTLPPHDLQRARSGWVSLDWIYGQYWQSKNCYLTVFILVVLIQNEQHLLLILLRDYSHDFCELMVIKALWRAERFPMSLLVPTYFLSWSLT